LGSSPKNENSVIPQVVPNLYKFLSSAEHRIRYFEEYFPILWKLMEPIKCLVTHILQNISRWKKFIQVWN